MFGKRFAYDYQGAGDGGWTPPWLHSSEEWRGPGGPGKGHGHHGPFGGPGPRFFLHAGRALLNERRQSEEEFSGPPWMRRRGRPHFSPELQALKTEAMEVVRLLTIAGRMSFEDAEQLARLRGIIERARKDLTDMIYGA